MPATALPFSGVPLIAGANITPCTFVQITGNYANSTFVGTTFTASPCVGSANLPIGVAAEWGNRAAGTIGDTGLHAAVGEQVTVFGAGQVVNLSLGGTVTFGSPLVANATGFGVAANMAQTANTAYLGAIALLAGVSGDKIPVLVLAPCPFKGA